MRRWNFRIPRAWSMFASSCWPRHGEHTQIDWTNSNLFKSAVLRRGYFELNLADPINRDPVDEFAAFVRRELNLHRERVRSQRVDVLVFQDQCLDERYRFTRGVDGLLLGDRSYPCQPRLPLQWPWTRPPTDLQPGSLQNKNPGGDDHQAAEKSFAVPPSPQGERAPERASDIIVACVILPEEESNIALEIEGHDDDPFQLPDTLDSRAARGTTSSSPQGLNPHHHHSSQMKS